MCQVNRPFTIPRRVQHRPSRPSLQEVLRGQRGRRLKQEPPVLRAVLLRREPPVLQVVRLHLVPRVLQVVLLRLEVRVLRVGRLHLVAPVQRFLQEV
jgi:hypothetical protein